MGRLVKNIMFVEILSTSRNLIKFKTSIDTFLTFLFELHQWEQQQRKEHQNQKRWSEKKQQQQRVVFFSLCFLDKKKQSETEC